MKKELTPDKFRHAFHDLVEDGLLKIFENVNGKVFMSIAYGGPKSISGEHLDTIIAEECNDIGEYSIELLKDAILPEEEFSHYRTDIDPIFIDYFVNRSSSIVGRVKEDAIAQGAAISSILVKHDDNGEVCSNIATIIIGTGKEITPENYKKILKHEITHVVIDYIVTMVDPDIWKRHDITEPEELHEFVEFIADFTQYAITMSQKGSDPISEYEADVDTIYTISYKKYHDVFVQAINQYIMHVNDAPIDSGKE